MIDLCEVDANLPSMGLKLTHICAQVTVGHTYSLDLLRIVPDVRLLRGEKSRVKTESGCDDDNDAGGGKRVPRHFQGRAP